MDATVTTMEQVMWTAFEILAPALAAALTWASAWLTGVIRARVKNDVAAGLLARLTESIAAAVGAVNQQSAEILGAARAPGSPAGRKLTKREASLLREAAMQYVREFWGPKGLRELAKVLNPGERDQDRAMMQLNRVIGTRVEAAVGDAKRSAASITTRPPAVWPSPPVGH